VFDQQHSFPQLFAWNVADKTIHTIKASCQKKYFLFKIIKLKTK